MFDISDEQIQSWIAEDVPYGDLTTHALGLGKLPGRMEFVARQIMTVAWREEAARIMAMLGASVTTCAHSGTVVTPGAQIAVAEGSAGALHAGWKVAQTLLEISGGIATATKAIVDAAQSVNPAVVVVCTRKCFPGAKALSIKAIMAGGAFPRRLGLSETVLVLAQHRAFLDNESLPAIFTRLRRRTPEKKIVIEADTLAEAIEVADAGADVVQVDKISAVDIAALRRHVDGQRRRPLIAAAGGINAGDYARAGADIIVTSAPYYSRPLDVKVVMTKRAGELRPPGIPEERTASRCRQIYKFTRAACTDGVPACVFETTTKEHLHEVPVRHYGCVAREHRRSAVCSGPGRPGRSRQGGGCGRGRRRCP